MDKEEEIPPDDLKEIESFLQDEMPADQKEAFIKKMQHDNNLRKNVEEMRLIALGIQESVLHEKLGGFHQELQKRPIKHLHLGKWLVAASLLALIGLVTLWITRSGSPDQQLFAAYFEPDPGLISEMSRSENYLFDRAMIDYKTGNYQEAIKKWQDFGGTATYSDTLDYFIGSAYISLKQTDKAIPHYEKVISSANSAFKYDAHWYMGLALLEKGKTQEAVTHIEQSGHQSKNALLKEIKSRND